MQIMKHLYLNCDLSHKGLIQYKTLIEEGENDLIPLSKAAVNNFCNGENNTVKINNHLLTIDTYYTSDFYTNKQNLHDDDILIELLSYLDLVGYTNSTKGAIGLFTQVPFYEGDMTADVTDFLIYYTGNNFKLIETRH